MSHHARRQRERRTPESRGREPRGHANDQGDGAIRHAPHILVCTYLAALVLAVTARAHPTPRGWHAPTWWLAQALCIHSHEGAWDDDTGNGYYGGMQFLASTWWSVGGLGYAYQWPPREQLYRAWLVYLRDGNSWKEWGTAGMCGLR